VSRILSNVNAHHEQPRKVEAANALAVAEATIRKMVGATTQARIAKAGATHGAGRAQANAEAAAKLIADFENLSPIGRQRALKQLDAIKADADVSRLTAKPPASGLNGTDFVAWADVPGSGTRGAIEHVESHGINVGVRNGILSLRRLYLPSATSLLSQMGGRS
jgi:hypothetical protein